MSKTDNFSDALRSRFELQAMSIAQLPETIEQNITLAGAQLTECLIQENKVHVLGLDDAAHCSAIFVEELMNSSEIDRPPLPSLLIQYKDAKSQMRHLQSLGEKGDYLIIFQGSQKHHQKEIIDLTELAAAMEIEVFIISSDLSIPMMSPAPIQIDLKGSSRMNYLCCLPVMSMTLVAIIDHNLFQHTV